MASHFLLLFGGLFAGIVARAFGSEDFSSSPVFQTSAYTLLAVGLYAAVAGIDVQEMRREWKTVFAAVTL